MEREGSLLGSQ